MRTILFALRSFKLFLDSLLEAKHRSKQLKICLANFGILLHLLNVFFVILPFNKTKGIFFSFIFIKKFGHISESTKQTRSGFHFSRNAIDKEFKSRGKNR